MLCRVKGKPASYSCCIVDKKVPSLAAVQFLKTSLCLGTQTLVILYFVGSLIRLLLTFIATFDVVLILCMLKDYGSLTLGLCIS